MERIDQPAARLAPLELADLTRDDIRARASGAVVILPVAATEQHGPHACVGTDTTLVWSVALAGARRASDIHRCETYVTPSLPYGISDHHRPHPGTMSLPATCFLRVLEALTDCLVESGFRRVILLNGHNGNDEAIAIAARAANNRHSDCSFAAASYWVAARDALEQAGLLTQVSRIPGHAGKFETSLLLHLGARFVRSDLRPASLPVVPARGPKVFRAGSRHGVGLGYSDAPREATAELGGAIFAALEEGLGDFIAQFRKET